MGRALSQNLREEIFQRDNYTCRYCGKKFPKNMLDVDHIRPVCLGGDNRESNLATACITCNRHIKREKRFIEYEDVGSRNEFDENYRKIVKNYGYYTNYIKKIFKNNQISMTRSFIHAFTQRSFHDDTDFEQFKKYVYSIKPKDIANLILKCNRNRISWRELMEIETPERKFIFNYHIEYDYSKNLFSFSDVLLEKGYKMTNDFYNRSEYFMSYYSRLIANRYPNGELQTSKNDFECIADALAYILSLPNGLVQLFKICDEYFDGGKDCLNMKRFAQRLYSIK